MTTINHAVARLRDAWGNVGLLAAVYSEGDTDG